MRQKKNVLDLAYEDTRLHRVSWREMVGPCPRPGRRCRRDGFHVDPERNPVRRFLQPFMEVLTLRPYVCVR